MDRARNFIPGPNQELLDIKPLRSLAPMFPAPMGVSINQSSTPPLVCVTPVGQFPIGFGAGNLPAFGSFATFSATANGFSDAGTSANGPIDDTPISAYKTRSSGVRSNGSDEPHSGNQTYASEREAKRSSGLAADGSNGVKAKRPKPDYKNLVAGQELAFLPASNSNPRDTVEAVHMIFEALRRRHLQIDETPDANRRADMKAGAIMMANNIRANAGKKVGTAPGVEIGDIFYFRMELCIIGLHAQIRGGIDYIGNGEDSVAICIVAAGGYENEDDDTDTLVYCGSGGNSKNTEERHDQKLERGNLALESSLHKKNEIRVVRGFKDPACVSGKIYMYDGLYKIQESWKERTKFGINCFKYRLQREPGQRDGAAIWKMTQGWIQNASTRGRVILHDLSSGAETIPVCLVNEVDREKGPGHFTYTNEVTYLRPLSSMRPLQGCDCGSLCLPGDSNCACGQHNGGDLPLPYNSSGVLVCRRPVIYECGEACHCSLSCRKRVTQQENRYHFEVFRTTDRGWGLRCWDPIRAGAFICEYTGEVVDLDDSEDDYIFQTLCPGEKTLKWNFGRELLGEESTYVSADEFEPLPIKISAKRRGNVSRFMNHSCSPNVFWQPVQYDHGDVKYPHIMFFALKHIPPMTELTYDYGVVGAEPRGRTRNCLCGSLSCRGVF